MVKKYPNSSLAQNLIEIIKRDRPRNGSLDALSQELLSKEFLEDLVRQRIPTAEAEDVFELFEILNLDRLKLDVGSGNMIDQIWDKYFLSIYRSV